MTISQTITAFLEGKATRSTHTCKAYQASLDHFLHYLSTQDIHPDKPAKEFITPLLAKNFNTWLAQQKWQRGKAGPVNLLSMRTRQLYIRAVLGYLKHLVLTDEASFDYGKYKLVAEELGEATKFEPAPVKTRTPDQEIVQAILDQAHKPPAFADDVTADDRARLMLIWQRNLALVLCLYSGGMRVAELAGLRHKDIDRRHQEFKVLGKGKKYRLVRVSDEAWHVLIEYLQAREGTTIGGNVPLFTRHDFAAGDQVALTTRSIQRIIYRLAVASGVATEFHLTPHSFRHYFATCFLQQTHDLALTQDALGHADPGTTRIYADTSDEDRRREHMRLFDND